MSSTYHRFAHHPFFRIFPPPLYLVMPTVGLDVSDRAIRFVELLPRENGNRIGRFGEVLLPDGVVVNGEIKDVDVLRDTLISIRKEHHITFVHTSLPEEKAFLVRVPVATGLSPREMKDNIGFQLDELVPVPASEADFDFVVADTLNQEDGDAKEAVVSVFPNSLVASYWDVFQSAGITPISFEMENTALARALLPPNDPETKMIVDMGERRTSIVISGKGVVRFTTSVDLGGSLFTDAIMEHLKVSHEDAIDLKLSGEFSRHGKYRELFPILVDACHTLTEEIRKHLIYWHNNSDQNTKASNPPIKSIILTGDGSTIEGLADRFGVILRIPVSNADVWGNVFSINDYVPPIPLERSMSYAVAVGLMLRDN